MIMARFRRKVIIKNEIKTGLTKWFNKSGKRVAEYNYENGEFQGLQTTFYDSDTIQTTTEYTNNVQNGEYKEYYRNGIVKLQGNFISTAPRKGHGLNLMNLEKQ